MVTVESGPFRKDFEQPVRVYIGDVCVFDSSNHYGEATELVPTSLGGGGGSETSHRHSESGNDKTEPQASQ